MNKKISICLICLSIFLMTKNTYADISIYQDYNGLGTDTLFMDDFSGKKLSQWTDTTDWTIADSCLKHNLSETAGTSKISNKLTDSLFYIGTTTWSIRLKSDFDVSSSNKFWYWLMASDSSLSISSTKGYAIGIYIAGSSKNILMYRIDGSSKTLLCTSSVEWVKNTNIDLIVVRDPKGEWQVGCSLASETADTVFNEKFTDNTYSDFAYHGLSFTYTKTRAGMLHADNIIITRQLAPTSLISVEYNGNGLLELTFSGNIDETSATERRNYTITNASVDDAVFNTNEPVKVRLSVSGIISGTYTITANGLKDAKGNNIETQTAQFSYTPPALPYDLVINELMFDPTPVIGLPNYDYLELYNRSGHDIQLGGWTLDISGTIRQIPDSVIKAGEYVILTAEAAIDSFSIYGNTIAAITQSNLPNTGRTLRLVSPEGTTIDSLTYTEKPIIEASKNNGGWSFERIDPDNFCGGWGNWAFSISEIGGTPGKKNSVYAHNIDNQPITITDFQPSSSNEVKIELSETPTQQSVSVLSNYRIANIGNPSEYQLDNTTLTLIFKRKFESDKNLELTISGLEDACGNVMTDTSINFSYHNTGLYELVINEIYATPHDNGILPEYEWVEIYNNSNLDIFLDNFTLGVGSKKYTLTGGRIASHDFAILTKSSNADSLKALGNIVPVIAMPALAQSATLALYNNSGEIICRTAYSASWFADDLKASGGYSLERIDFNNSDESAANWMQSESPSGATPGRQNSIYYPNPDSIAPQLLQVIPVSEKILHLIFSETINLRTANTENIDIQPNIGNPSSVEISTSSMQTIIINLAETLLEDETYTLTIDSLVTDIAGNYIGNRKITFGLPKQAQDGDIVINEILFNPYPNGSDFIELYNRSDHPVNISDFIVASRSDGNLKSPKRIDSPGFVLMPGDYVAISTDINNISATYKCGNLYKVSSLPSMPDDAGSVVLTDTAGNVYDEINYTDKMQFALLKDLNGVSLERVDYNQPADNQANWHSASQLSGWATPGLENSVHKEVNIDTEENISLNCEVFSPDNDGFEDQIEITYNFDVAGYVANVTIFNAKGLKMRTLAANELLGTTGFWAWDGLDDNCRRVPTGIYVIHCEFFDLDGRVKKEQKVCVVSTKM